MQNFCAKSEAFPEFCKTFEKMFLEFIPLHPNENDFDFYTNPLILKKINIENEQDRRKNFMNEIFSFHVIKYKNCVKYS